MSGSLCSQVSYNITGWLEKNKDPLNDTVVDQFKKGQNALLVEIFADHPGQSGGGAADAGGGKGKYRRFTALPRRVANFERALSISRVISKDWQWD